MIWSNDIFERALFFSFLGSTPCVGSSIGLWLVLESVALSCSRQLATDPKDEQGTVLEIMLDWELLGVIRAGDASKVVLGRLQDP